jgi:predicted esterase
MNNFMRYGVLFAVLACVLSSSSMIGGEAFKGAVSGAVSMDGSTIQGSWDRGSSLHPAFWRQVSVPVTGKMRAAKSTFEFAGKARTYSFFIPDGEGPLPLVLLLHGSGRNGQVMVDAWKDLASKEHFIVVGPDSYDSSGWGVKMDSPAFFHAVVEQVKAIHAVDESRIYLFGHSAGAVHALVLAIIDSHYYAATAVHAGALPPGYEKQLFSYAERRMPIAIWVGDKDPLFPADAVMATKRQFEANGFHVELSILPDHDHNYYAISDEVNGKAWDFLKTTRLE